jgi:hypothetical protein
MSWCWIALVGNSAPGADAAAAATTADGRPAGTLAVWLRRAKPTRSARRMDVRLADPDGAAATVSLVLAPPGVRLPFDDVAVQHARRRVLAEAPFDGVSTLLADASHFAGAVTVARGGGQVARLPDDPFARLFAARVLRIAAGVLGSVAPPAGPTIERYGSAQPWPWDRFSAP